MTNETRYTESESEQIAEYSRETYDEYLEDVKDVHKTVSEDSVSRIFADRKGHEITEWANDIGVSREVVSAWMHDKAREQTDYNWSTSDPVVLLKD